MAFNFPDSPSVNDEYTAGDRTWVWDGTVWVDKGSTLSFDELTNSTHATTHESGGSDVLTLAQSQVTDLVSDLADKADNADFTGGTAGYTALSNGTAGLSYQPVSHNYIINGAFDIWQRGDGPFTANEYTADRWNVNSSGGTASVTQESFTPAELNAIGFGDAEFYFHYDLTGADDNANFGQHVEDVRTLAGQTVTLSFWAKSASEVSILSQLRQEFGSGGSSVAVTTLGTLSIGTSWARYSLTGTLPSVSGKTIGTGSYLDVFFVNPVNEVWDIDLWGVQLEAGSIATPFKRNANSIQGELAACQRYYYRINASTSNQTLAIYGSAGSTTLVSVAVPIPSELRVNPTGLDFSGLRVFDGNSSTNVSAASLGTSSKNSVLLNLTVSGVTQFRPYRITSQDSNSHIGLIAEL